MVWKVQGAIHSEMLTLQEDMELRYECGARRRDISRISNLQFIQWCSISGRSQTYQLSADEGSGRDGEPGVTFTSYFKRYVLNKREHSSSPTAREGHEALPIELPLSEYNWL